MSKAYKCDRCGELYSNHADISNKYMILIPDYMDDRRCLEDGYVDLCPNCQEQLEKWLGFLRSD